MFNLYYSLMLYAISFYCSNDLILAMYFPKMSNSKLTTVPTFMSQKFVCSIVYGIIATWNVSSVGLHTVRETPLTVTLPLSTVK